MDKIYPFFLRIMIWGSVPLVFFIECWEQSLNVSNSWQIFFQILVLLVTLKWILFWNRRLTELELEICYREWDSHRDSYKRETR